MDPSMFRTRAEDGVESEMAPDAVHREKGMARGALGVAVMYGTVVAGTSSMTVMAGAPAWTLVVPAVLAAGVGLFALTKTVIRTAVTQREVIIRSGMSEHRVPLAAITSVELREAGLLSPRGVQLQYAEGGKPRRFWMAARNPEVLIAAIEQVRSAKPSATNVRVAVSDESVDTNDDEQSDAASEHERSVR